jgi:peptide chain release factor 1
LEQQLASPDLDVALLTKLGKEYSSLGRLVALTDQRDNYVKNISELAVIEAEETKNGTGDEEMAQLARSEREDVETLLRTSEEEIIRVLTPVDEADDRNVVLEVRAGTGAGLETG